MSRRVPTRWINHETTMSRNRFLTAISAHLTLITVALTEGSKPFFQNLIFERLPIDYHDAGIFDPISKLAVKIKSGDIKLQHDDNFGYLRSVREAFDVPISS